MMLSAHILSINYLPQGELELISAYPKLCYLAKSLKQKMWLGEHNDQCGKPRM